MKLPRIFNFSRHIAFRLTWRVVLAVTVVFTLLTGLILTIIWAVGAAMLAAFFQSALEISNERINNVFSKVEIALTNNIPEAMESAGNKDMAFFASEHLLKLNPTIVGATVALNPDYEPMKGIPFAPYTYRDSTGIKKKMLNNPSYNYLQKEWYTKPIKEKKGVWTEPYVDMGGGEILMTTYSLPLKNSKGEIYAIQTADIAIDWIANMADSIGNFIEYDFLPFNNKDVLSFIVTKKGGFVVHPDRDMVQKETLSDYIKRAFGIEDTLLVQKLALGSEYMDSFEDSKGKTYFMFTAPVEHTEWTMCVTMPLSKILRPVNSFIKAFAVILLIGLVIVALVCRSFIRRVTKPLTRFADSADEIAKGNIETELPQIKSKDEMLRLHNSFKTMQLSLVKQMEQIKAVNEEKGRLEGELHIARNIQMAMLPKTFPAFPDRNDIDIFAQVTPAKEVGGDLYDYHIRDEKLFFCVGDVSGKGIPASLVMVVTRALFRTASAHESNPGRILAGINNLMVEDNDSNMFVTLFIGVIDLPTGRMRYSNAGHDSPILISDLGVHMLECDPNLPCGIMADFKFTTQETVIQPMTTIFLYTDGLTEAENVDHDLFQDDRILLVAKQVDRKPMTLIEQMDQAVHLFVGEAEQSDDLTMLAIQYTKQQEKDIHLQRSITLSNDVEEIPQLSAFTNEICELLDLDVNTTMSICLAVEEVVVNVMDYAYPDGTKGDVQIEAVVNSKYLKFIITDQGIPFDPTAQTEIDTTLSAEERQIGGLGIHLVRNIMDSINYERVADKNVLTIKKKILSSAI